VTRISTRFSGSSILIRFDNRCYRDCAEQLPTPTLSLECPICMEPVLPRSLGSWKGTRRPDDLLKHAVLGNLGKKDNRDHSMPSNADGKLGEGPYMMPCSNRGLLILRPIKPMVVVRFLLLLPNRPASQRCSRTKAVFHSSHYKHDLPSHPNRSPTPPLLKS
jgi:hypothetical protein